MIINPRWLAITVIENLMVEHYYSWLRLTQMVWCARMSRSHVDSSVMALTMNQNRTAQLSHEVRCKSWCNGQQSFSHLAVNDINGIGQPDSCLIVSFRDLWKIVALWRRCPTHDLCQLIQSHRLMSHQIAPLGPITCCWVSLSVEQTKPMSLARIPMPMCEPLMRRPGKGGRKN